MSAKRKTSHGTLANQIFIYGNNHQNREVRLLRVPKEYGKSIGRHAPGMLMRRSCAAKSQMLAGNMIEFSTYRTKLSQTFHAYGSIKKEKFARSLI